MNRRYFLKAASGISIALPFFPSLARAANPQPKRFIAFCHPNGVFEYPANWSGAGRPANAWYPAGDENHFTLGTSNASLDALRSHCLWVTGLNLAVAVNGVGEQHQRGLGGLLTGTALQAGLFVGNDGTKAGWANGASIDQELINYIGVGSKAASIQLGVHAAERDVSGVLSYAGPSRPLLPQNDPVVVFRNLFSDITTPPGELEVIRRRRASVLDAVVGQIASLQGKLSANERTQLDQHLTMVRELELRVSTMTAPPVMLESCTQATEPPPMQAMDVSNMAALSKLQLDIVVLAFQCDMVRIATIEYSDVKNHIALPFLGVSSDVHNTSHASDPSSLDDLKTSVRPQLAKRDTWQAEQVAYFLQRLKDTNGGDGTPLINHTLLFWGSEISIGNTHSHVNMPFMLAGGGAGFRMGRWINYGGQPHNNLLLSIMNAFGAPNTTFGDSTFCDGPLTNLF